MMNGYRKSGLVFAGTVAVATLAVAGLRGQAPQNAMPAKDAVTFTKDVAPILEAKCEGCHRPGSMAPMSLLTYQDVRPWARSIKDRVVRREMPPWFLDKTVGIQKFKNDISLSDQQIDTIVKWIDAGAPMGNPKDMPAPVQWTDADEWHIGKPDIIVTSTPYMVPAHGPDWWPDVVVDPHITEDRYIKAIETKPVGISRRVVHHAGTGLVDASGQKTESLSEFAVGKYGDIYPEGAGRLLKAGSKINFSLHLHSVGEEIPAEVSVGYVLYPKGYVPKHKIVEVNVGVLNGHLFDDLDIPANTVTRHDAYAKLTQPAHIISYQPHMHMRGKAMTMEAIYPGGQAETINSVDRFDFNWHVAYVYADDVAPLLPASTILHIIGIHDNTAAHRGNPDPNQWVGFGNRTFDDMLQCHVLLYYMDEAEYKQEVADRQAKLKTMTNNNSNQQQQDQR
jgi:hypothetical protein